MRLLYSIILEIYNTQNNPTMGTNTTSDVNEPIAVHL